MTWWAPPWTMWALNDAGFAYILVYAERNPISHFYSHFSNNWSTPDQSVQTKWVQILLGRAVEVFMSGWDRAEEYSSPARLYRHRPVSGPCPTQATNLRPKPTQNQARPGPAKASFLRELYGFSSRSFYFVFTFKCIPMVFDLTWLTLKAHAQPYNTCAG